MKHTISQMLHKDMEWWRETLSKCFIGIKIIKPMEPLNFNLMVNALTSWGIGLTLDDRWLAWELLPVMSLQALYTQNLRIYPFITQYLRNDTIIILTHSIILPALNNTTDFRSICHPHTDTILKL